MVSEAERQVRTPFAWLRRDAVRQGRAPCGLGPRGVLPTRLPWLGQCRWGHGRFSLTYEMLPRGLLGSSFKIPRNSQNGERPPGTLPGASHPGTGGRSLPSAPHTRPLSQLPRVWRGRPASFGLEQTDVWESLIKFDFWPSSIISIDNQATPHIHLHTRRWRHALSPSR